MDVIVTAMLGGRMWDLGDLLGRSIGRMTEDENKFCMYPEMNVLLAAGEVYRNYFTISDDTPPEAA